MTSTTLVATPTASTTLSTVHRRTIPVVAGGGLISSATFTRADTAKYFDSDGVMQEAASGEARTTYIGGNPYLWVDGSNTEDSGYSADLTSWDTVTTASVAKDVVGLTGSANEAFTVTDDSAAARQTRAKNYTIADDSKTRYGIFRVAKNASPSVYPLLRIENTGGTTELAQSVVLDPSDGSTTEVDSDGSEVIVQEVGDFYHVVLSLANNGSGNTVASLPISPAYNADASASEAVSAQGDTVVATAELYADNFSFHHILTTGGTTATIAADVASLTNSIISSLTEGVIYAEVWRPSVETDSFTGIAELRTDDDNRIRLNYNSAGVPQIAAWNTTTLIVNETGSPARTAGTLEKVALAFNDDDWAMYRDGSQDATDSSGDVPSVDTLFIGMAGAAQTNQLYGGIKTLNVYPTRLSNSELASLTT